VYQLCAVADVPHPGPYQHWELVRLAEQTDRLWHKRNAYNLANHAAMHGVSKRAEVFNPYEQSLSAAEKKQWAEEAKDRLPDDLDNEEIMDRWEDFKEEGE